MIMKLYVIQRTDTKQVFAGFAASHRFNNPRCNWERMDNAGEPISICLYPEKDERSFSDVQSFTPAECIWISMGDLCRDDCAS